MKSAIEFFRDYGVGEANRILIAARGCDTTKLYSKYEFKVDDLKRLVESHELVKEHGTIERAKQYADSKYTAPEVSSRLKQAIADVESCKRLEVGDGCIPNHCHG